MAYAEVQIIKGAIFTLMLPLGVEVTLSSVVDEVEEGGTFDVCVSREAVPLQNNISITLVIPEEQQSEERKFTL